jgi:hypothetical protein
MKILRREAPETEKVWSQFPVMVVGWICLGLLLFDIVHRIWTALFIPWWFNTDEVVIYYEVIRQLRLDPSQTFFDIPGTPFMSLTSILTALWWVGDRMFGLTHTGNPSDFAFANVQGVFTLMRSITLAMYVGSVALAYDVFRRCAGALVGVAAGILCASLPIFVEYSYFVRTESLGLVLCLSAIWVVLYSRWRGTPGGYGAAGALAGVAMAARYHFALVGFPVILLIFFLQDRHNLPDREGAGDSALYEVAGTVGALLFAGSLVTLALKLNVISANGLTNAMMLTTASGAAQYAGAKAFIAKLWMLLGLMAGAVLAAHKVPRGRRWLWPAVNPFTLMAGIGFMIGFLLSHPEFLWRGDHQLRSIQFYSDWTDAGLSQLGPIASWWKVSEYYFVTAFPERWAQALFITGVLAVLWRRRPVHVALAGGALLCFFAHPLHMKLWPHHVIPWLPLLCFVAAVPIGEAGIWLLQRYRHTRFVSTAIVILAAAVLVGACGLRLKGEGAYVALSRSRTDQIAAMNSWLSKNVSPDTYLLVSYYALNDDGFREWIQTAGVTVPQFVKKHRNVHIWWLDRSSVDNRTGIVCMSRADVAFFHDDFERRKPGSTYNPFQNRNFVPLATFGGGFYELTVFRFDCQSKSCSL